MTAVIVTGWLIIGTLLAVAWIGWDAVDDDWGECAWRVFCAVGCWPVGAAVAILVGTCWAVGRAFGWLARRMWPVMTAAPRIELVTSGVSGPWPEELPWRWQVSCAAHGVDVRGAAPSEAEAWAEARVESRAVLDRLETTAAGRAALTEAAG